MNSRRTVCLTACVFLLHLSSLSQTAPAKPVATPAAAVEASPQKSADYSQEGVVIESFFTNVKFEADGTSTREVHAVARVQDDAGVKELAVLSFAFTSETENVDVDYVRVRKPDGTTINTPSYNIQEMPADVTREAPMYSDIHEKHVTVKGLGVGDTLEYLIRFRTVKPEIPGQFWYEHAFLKAVVCKEERLRISAPKDKYLNVSSPDLQPKTTEEGDRKIYEWKTANLAREVPNPKELPKRESPRPSVEVSTFHSWEEVGHWYGELEKPQLAITPAITAKAAELTKGLPTDEQKIRALYAYVATRFHYISLSFGIGRYQPHSADEVLGNEYGDCKDKHTLLATLLKAVGIDAWPVMINATRKIDKDIPAPSAFDHVITVVPQGSKLVWLDTTPEVAPYGVLMTLLRDKQALVIPTNAPASLMMTPAGLPFRAVQSFDAEGKLDSDGTYTGHVKQSTRGDSEVVFRAAFRRVPKAQWKEFTQGFSYRLGFGGDVTDVIASSPEDFSKPFEFSYNYTRKTYSDWEHRKIAPPLPPFGIESYDQDERKPVEPLLLGAEGEIVYRAKVELPPWATPKPPQDVNLTYDFADYHSHYTFEKGILTAERQLVIKKPEVALSSWDSYTKFRKAVMDDENYYIDLTGAGGDNSKAGQKLDEASQAITAQDFMKAAKLAREALELDPKYPRAHLVLSQATFAQGNIEVGVAELKKEEEVNPTFTSPYMMLGTWYARMRREEDSLEQWRKLLKVEPGNLTASMFVGQRMMKDAKYGEAIGVFETSLKANPDNKILPVELGTAYLKAGQKDKGLAVMQKALGEGAEPMPLNNAAWVLAENEIDLELAKKYSEESLEKLNDPKLEDVSSIQSLQRTDQLGSYWDTLGWVYFKMGNMPKAASYLKAAWMLSQHAVSGDHLAQVYQKQGKTAQAEHLYRLALAASSITQATRDEIRQRYQKLTGKPLNEQSFTRRLPDGTWTVTPAEELSRARTMNLTKDTHGTGNATFSIVVTPQHVEGVTYVSGSEDLKAVAEKLKSMKMEVAVPDDASAIRMVRRGIVTCGSTGCDFTLLLPQNAFENMTGASIYLDSH